MFEMLSNAQRMRIDEQRGVGVANGDLPSFLCEDNYATDLTRTGEEDDIDHHVHLRLSDMGTPHTRASPGSVVTPRPGAHTHSDSKQAFGTPGPDKWKIHADRGYAQNGVTPSPRVVPPDHLRMTPMVVDSRISTLTQSLDFESMHHNHSQLQTLDNFAMAKTETDTSMLGGSLSSHLVNDSHAFRPLHSKAPTASPEKFSPAEGISPQGISPQGISPLSKKLRGNSEVFNFNNLLPNKSSPNTRRSSSSSSVSSGNPSSPLISKGVPQKSVQRLSDAMLAQKLHQALRDKEQTKLDNHDIGANHNDKLFHIRQSVSEGEGEHVRKSLSAYEREQSDLAQRALLSPRFDQSSPVLRRGSPNALRQSLPVGEALAQAALSPRLQQRHNSLCKDQAVYFSNACSPNKSSHPERTHPSVGAGPSQITPPYYSSTPRTNTPPLVNRNNTSLHTNTTPYSPRTNTPPLSSRTNTTPLSPRSSPAHMLSPRTTPPLWGPNSFRNPTESPRTNCSPPQPPYRDPPSYSSPRDETVTFV